mmetsp:Transcript_36260/g.86440  ORF Transcript_36260/g.86440 Transcript_36260/m.86440 type:complete len:330 (+) Transcript_36260:269-1258(+)
MLSRSILYSSLEFLSSVSGCTLPAIPSSKSDMLEVTLSCAKSCVWRDSLTLSRSAIELDGRGGTPYPLCSRDCCPVASARARPDATPCDAPWSPGTAETSAADSFGRTPRCLDEAEFGLMLSSMCLKPSLSAALSYTISLFMSTSRLAAAVIMRSLTSTPFRFRKLALIMIFRRLSSCAARRDASLAPKTKLSLRISSRNSASFRIVGLMSSSIPLVDRKAPRSLDITAVPAASPEGPSQSIWLSAWSASLSLPLLRSGPGGMLPLPSPPAVLLLPPTFDDDARKIASSFFSNPMSRLLFTHSRGLRIASMNAFSGRSPGGRLRLISAA